MVIIIKFLWGQKNNIVSRYNKSEKENTYFYHISLGSFIISCMPLTKEKLKTDW